ncbi:hypothetical protein ACU4GD_08470 [Cupriavidus basilensis]
MMFDPVITTSPLIKGGKVEAAGHRGASPLAFAAGRAHALRARYWRAGCRRLVRHGGQDRHA